MRILPIAILLCSLSCGGQEERLYAHNDLQLLTGYGAKDLCSCLFVMEREEAFCRSWTRASPNLKTMRIDHERKTVETQAVLFWGARARYLGPRKGCVLE